VLQVKTDSFFEWAKAIEIGLEGFAYVVDAKGQIAFHSKHPGRREIVDFSAAPLVQKLVRGERGVEIALDPFEQENSVFAYAPVDGYGWGVVAQQPTRTAFAAKNQQLTRLLIAYGLTLLFFVSGIYLASRIMMQRRQAEEDRRIKAGLERRVDGSSEPVVAEHDFPKGAVGHAAALRRREVGREEVVDDVPVEAGVHDRQPVARDEKDAAVVEVHDVERVLVVDPDPVEDDVVRPAPGNGAVRPDLRLEVGGVAGLLVATAFWTPRLRRDRSSVVPGTGSPAVRPNVAGDPRISGDRSHGEQVERWFLRR